MCVCVCASVFVCVCVYVCARVGFRDVPVFVELDRFDHRRVGEVRAFTGVRVCGEQR